MKILCVPISTEAMERLDYDSCIEGDLIELELTQAEFDKLHSIGLFDALNQNLGIMIDEFEDECIQADQLGHALQVLKQFNYSKQMGFLTTKINDLLLIAKEAQTGLFFYF